MGLSNKATVIVVGPRYVADETVQQIMAANLHLTLVMVEDNHDGTPGVRRIELEAQSHTPR